MTRVVAIRGATTLESDCIEQMLDRVPEMIGAIYERNQLTDSEVISMIFTATPDIHSMFPPTAARRVLGLEHVPMMGAVEMEVEGSVALCVRVMLHVSVPGESRRPGHVYLHGAQLLRPDLDDV